MKPSFALQTLAVCTAVALIVALTAALMGAMPVLWFWVTVLAALVILAVFFKQPRSR